MLKNYLRGLGSKERRRAITAFAEITPETDDWLHDWVHIYLGVFIPRVQVCSHHSAPFEAFAHSYFARTPMAIWEGSRGFSGKSMQLSTLDMTEMITLGANTRILGGSGEQAQRINAYIRNEDPNSKGLFWEAPLAPKHLLGSSTKTELRTTNGGYVKALMASSTSIRGAHPHRLKIDEADEMPIDLFDASMGQTMSSNGVKAQTTISSTHQYPDGTMTELKRRAKEKGFPVFTWCYKETMQPHGWLDPAEVERKRQEVPEAMFRNEYDLQEPNPEGRIFDEEVLEFLFDESLGVYEGAAGQTCDPIPPGLGDFYTGVDWGKRRDWTVIHTMRQSSSGPDQLAAWLRLGRMPWPDMVGRANERVEAYGGRSMHDETGLGDAIADLGLDSRFKGFNFSDGKGRDAMYNNYINAVERGELVYPDIRYLRDSHKYLTHDQVYGSEHVPDDVVAAALAWKARRSSKAGLLVGRI